jgi:hypothetical protein
MFTDLVKRSGIIPAIGVFTLFSSCVTIGSNTVSREIPTEISEDQVPDLGDTLWQLGNSENGKASYCRFYHDGYMMYISDIGIVANYFIGYPWNIDGFDVTFKLGRNTFQGYFVNENYIHRKNGTALTRVTDETIIEKYDGEALNFSPMEIFPQRAKEISGNGSRIQISNPNDFFIAAAVVTSDSGRYLMLPPRRGEVIDVPNGQYDIYFVYATDPESLYQGDSFSVRQQQITITIQMVEDGNYGIKKVK